MAVISFFRMLHVENLSESREVLEAKFSLKINPIDPHLFCAKSHAGIEINRYLAQDIKQSSRKKQALF
jgi:hypothetical protein